MSDYNNSLDHSGISGERLAYRLSELAAIGGTEDGAGKVFDYFEGKTDFPYVLSGSHLDSVPNGGHSDGSLGVLAALEVAEAWKETGFQPTIPYEIVIFTDEEIARFSYGLTGSRAMTGEVEIEQ